MNTLGKIGKAAISIIGGLMAAEGICIVSNALIEDVSRVKGGFDKVIAKPTAPPAKSKRKWGRGRE